MADKKISALTGATTPLAGTEVLPIVQGGTTVKVSVDNLTAGKLVTASAVQLGDIGATDATFQGRIKLEDGAVSLQNGGGLEFVTASFGSGYGWKINSIDSAGAQLLFGYRQNSVDWTEAMRLTSDGNLKISTANKGIDFSANTHAAGMTSELLNDYEEGTWTPTLTATTSGTITISSPTNSLNYTKIGRLVTVTGRITVSSVSLPLGLLILGGLPISSGGSGSNNSGAGAVYADSLTTNTALSARISENATTAIIATPNQGDAAPLIQGGTNLYINIAYTV